MKERKRERRRDGGKEGRRGNERGRDGRREGEGPSARAGEFSSTFLKQVLLYIKDN